MRYRAEYVLFSLIVVTLFLSSCGNKRFLKSHSFSEQQPRKRVYDEYMLMKNQLNLAKQKYKIQEDSDNLLYELSTIIRQNPDGSIFRGFRQWMYHLNDTLSIPYRFDRASRQIQPDTIRRKSSGVQKWLHNKLGRAPVVLDTAQTRRAAESMQRYLHNKSYFNAKVDYTITYKRHKAFVTYNIKTGKPLLVDSLIMISKDTAILAIMEEVRQQSKLSVGQPISEELVLAEKNRLTLAIRNRGYYNFNWNYIIAKVDTVNAREVAAEKPKFLAPVKEQGEPRGNLYLEVLPYSDTSITHPKYKICNVYITPNEYILEAHKKRKIKKDSFFIVERTLRDRHKQIWVKDGKILEPLDSIIRRKKLPTGEWTKLVLRSVPRVKKMTLMSRDELGPNDKLVHVVLRKLVKNDSGKKLSWAEKRRKYFIRDKVISDAVLVQAGDWYSYDESQESVKAINNLNVFRFPRVEYVPSSNGNPMCLDCLVKMQPGKKQGFGGDLEVNNNYATVSSLGIAANAFYQNKNIFKGAETFEISATGGIDFRISGDTVGESNKDFFERAVNLLDINAEASLYFPRFLGLPIFEKGFKMENPSTKIALGYRFLQQSTDFVISSVYAKMGYEWSRGVQHAFSWNPILVNLTFRPELDPTFARLLEQNNLPLFISLSSSFLIPSMDFSYTFTQPERKSKGGAWSFRTYSEVAGNLFYAIDKVLMPAEKLRFGGVDYSQYFRTDFDIRYSYKLNKQHSIVSRLMLGIIIPYGNSENTEVPFVKRFTLGGPSSMRAWNLRYLGPGDQPSVPGAEFQLGDLRFEFNTEYRFMFNSWIGGALFADIGNVWLLNTNTPTTSVPQQNPKTGVFSERFYEQLAIGAGVGLRFDLSFFIFRVDFALQLRDPQGYRLKDDGTIQYWNFDPFVFERNKFVIAIGYPF